MNNLDQYYRLLELEPGASLEEVNQAYKDLAFIWHPDRIPEDNHRLRQKAEEKLKEINLAREQLRSLGKTTRVTRQRPQPSPQSARTRTYHQPKRPYHQPKRPHYQSRPQTHYQSRTPHPDLSGADFRGANLKEKDLSGRNLSNANLSQANLSDAFLHKINLQGANLEGANLFRANLLQANLRHACLKNTNLIGADLSGADLTSADLTGAKIGSKERVLVKLTGTKLSGAVLPDGTICD
ncbi:MAG: DnaJ domain-containing protein [Symploca sp. SIO2E6]|nr:DnaJ domain-containing protein [Symploca sp. SIO2E6]